MERSALEVLTEKKENEMVGICRRSWNESKKLWEITAPAMLSLVAQFSFEFVSTAFIGHVGELELAAVSFVHNVIEGFVYGIMIGMASALETLCGQAVGAEQFEMLGIYMQRSWVITSVTALVVTPFFVFTAPLLKLLHQSSEISELAGKYAMWVIPQVYAYAVNFPIQKFLQAQSKMWVMTTICVVMLGFHILFNWILVSKLGHGLLGAAIAGNISWWIMVLAQLVYVVSGFFPDAWTGFSLLAFKSLSSFVKLSLASAFMVCLELWYATILILMVGWLSNPKISVDAVSICMNFQFWTMMVFLGFGTAISVRVSNELGAGRPRDAKFSVAVAVVTSISIGIVFTILILAFKGDYPKLFSGKTEVVREASKLGYFLTGTVFLNSIQPVLYGVAVGAGWQLSVALVNAASYYVFGLPLGALLGYKFKLRAQGIWAGILAGCLLQTIVLMVTVLRTNWQKEVVQAEERVRSHAITASPENGNGATEVIAAQRLTRSVDEVPKSSSISNL